MGQTHSQERPTLLSAPPVLFFLLVLVLVVFVLLKVAAVGVSVHQCDATVVCIIDAPVAVVVVVVGERVVGVGDGIPDVVVRRAAEAVVS